MADVDEVPRVEPVLRVVLLVPRVLPVLRVVDDVVRVESRLVLFVLFVELVELVVDVVLVVWVSSPDPGTLSRVKPRMPMDTLRQTARKMCSFFIVQ